MARGRTIVFAWLCMVASCGGGKPRPANRVAAPEPTKLADPTNETIGGIGVGDTVAAVATTFGAPSSKGDTITWEATGESTATWTWADRGVSLEMEMTDSGPTTVSSIKIEAPGRLTTSRGVGIGTRYQEVERIYGKFRRTDRQEDEPETWGPEGIIVGSAYWGTFFHFTNGKVSSIFVGAVAD